MELAIDTSTRYAGVAISQEGEVLAELAWRSEQNHSVELLPAVQYLMQRVGASAGDLQLIIVATGPGSFSALRVGMSTAKGLAMAHHVPLVGVGTLEVEAFPHLATGLPVCSVIQAGRGQVAAYRQEQGAWVTTPNELGQTIQAPTIFCGEGVAAIAGFLRESLGERALIADVPLPTRRPGILARLGMERWRGGHVDTLATLQPLYLRGPSITTPKHGRVAT